MEWILDTGSSRYHVWNYVSATKHLEVETKIEKNVNVKAKSDQNINYSTYTEIVLYEKTENKFSLYVLVTRGTENL